MKTEEEIRRKLKRVDEGKFKVYIPIATDRKWFIEGVRRALEWVLEE